MGYIKTTIGKGAWIGKKFGKYFIGHFDESIKQREILYADSSLNKNALMIFGRYPLTFPEHIKVKEITFDLETKTIAFEFRLQNRKCVTKEIKNITNNTFFEYVRKNIERLFPAYDVKPNKDRTKFKLKLKPLT